MTASTAFPELLAFRARLHGCFTRRADALFELSDALLTADAMVSLPHLSLEPGHQRGWGSVYAALAHGRIDTAACQTTICRSLLPDAWPVFAVDVSTWPRCDAEASPERGFSYHPSRHSAGQPIVAGWAYQWIAQLSPARDSWTAPIDARRIHPTANTNQAAVTQIRDLARVLPGEPAPLFVFDAGYDPVQLSLGLIDTRAAILVRLRSGRCLDADPPPAPPGRVGRPRRHGAKLDTSDPATWPAPTATLTVADTQYGQVSVQTWAGLHPKQQLHPTRGTKQPRPIVRGTATRLQRASLVRVQVQRVPARTRPPKVLWLWWAGPGRCDPDLAWRAYIRRFDLEHTIRFVKQSLAGRPHAFVIPSGLTAGPGSWSPPTPNCGWPAPRRSISDCPGNAGARLAGSPRSGSAADFRNSCSAWAHRPTRRNPADAPQVGHEAANPVLRPAIQLSRKPPDQYQQLNHKLRAPN
jgi:DDE superfamily endonuclease